MEPQRKKIRDQEKTLKTICFIDSKKNTPSASSWPALTPAPAAKPGGGRLTRTRIEKRAGDLFLEKTETLQVKSSVKIHAVQLYKQEHPKQHKFNTPGCNCKVDLYTPHGTRWRDYLESRKANRLHQRVFTVAASWPRFPSSPCDCRASLLRRCAKQPFISASDAKGWQSIRIVTVRCLALVQIAYHPTHLCCDVRGDIFGIQITPQPRGAFFCGLFLFVCLWSRHTR